MKMEVANLVARGLLDPFDEQLARSLTRMAKEEDPLCLLAVALLGKALRRGELCIHLGPQDLGGEEEETVEPDPEDWPEPDLWARALARSPLVGDPAAPLVLEENSVLSLRRYHEHQRRIADSIRLRCTASDSLRPEVDDSSIDRLFPEAEEGDLQREAALRALEHPLSILSGGPGTGKTTTVVKILALVVEAFRKRAGRLPRIALAAPTGKAAARLLESISAASARLDLAASVREALPQQALTIHRLLRPLPGPRLRFRHDESTPLALDLLVVDEASMIDVALMRHLLAALPESCRVLLVGDKDQLASVEAGAVLGDLSRAAASPSSFLNGKLVQLQKSYRFDAGSGVGSLARAINRGDEDEARRLLEDGVDGQLQWIRVEGAPWNDRQVVTSIQEGFSSSHAPDRSDEERLEALGSFRILCAHRRGNFGAAGLNAWARERHGGRSAGSDEILPIGTPLLVTRNDAGQNLFNGDLGVIVAEDPQLCVFPDADGRPRRLSRSRLPPHEVVYAMSIHKSQGSEFQDVMVVLPEKPSRILGRELLYTGVTRARRRLVLVASEESLSRALAEKTRRRTRLEAMLTSS